METKKVMKVQLAKLAHPDEGAQIVSNAVVQIDGRCVKDLLSVEARRRHHRAGQRHVLARMRELAVLTEIRVQDAAVGVGVVSTGEAVGVLAVAGLSYGRIIATVVEQQAATVAEQATIVVRHSLVEVDLGRFPGTVACSACRP